MKPSNNSDRLPIDGGSGDLTNISQALYRLDLCYVGSSYLGFQSQPNRNTIQDHLEACLATFCRQTIRITAASRTDTGVHAEQQVVTFRGDPSMDPVRLVKGLNALLPRDIKIMNARRVEDGFHPIFNCTGKIYRYWIWRSYGESPFLNPFCWNVTGELDVESMLQASSSIIGEHDFTSFCASDSTAKSKIRRLREVSIVSRGPLLELMFLGDGFLKQMIRNLVGALVAVGRKKINVHDLRAILEAKDRTAAPSTAPAEGLCLLRIFYGDDTDIATLLEKQRKEYNLNLYTEWL